MSVWAVEILAKFALISDYAVVINPELVLISAWAEAILVVCDLISA